MSKVIIDVREPYEYDLGHVEGAKNIPLSKLAQSVEIPGVSRETEIILYCNSGNRSGMALDILKQKGFKNLINGISRQHVIKNYINS